MHRPTILGVSGDEQRFWSKVDKRGPDECWPWTAATLLGYGVFWVRGKNVKAHRYAYELVHGEPPPPRMHLDHECHNRDGACPGGETCPHRACCNPRHVRVATARQNILAGRGEAARNAEKTHCPHGHPYDEANTMTSGGRRRCRACARAGFRRWYATRKL